VTAPWVWNEGYLTLWFESELSTDLENIWGNSGNGIAGGKQSACKFIINGQLYILCDGKAYNVQGVQVK
jgi:hypothetical protein